MPTVVRLSFLMILFCVKKAEYISVPIFANTILSLEMLKSYNGQNFHLWKFHLRAILLGQNLMDIVDSTILMPTTPEQQIEWIKKDNQCIALLCKAVDES